MSDTLLLTPKSRTLGPVADLEKHLPSDWWKTLFNSLYLKTDGDVVENTDNTAQEINTLITALKLEPYHRILDLCCGQGRHVLELCRRGYENVMGIDRSRYLIRIAKKRAQQKNYLVRFSEGDARKIRLNESSLDCVTLFGNSFGYFESQQDDVAVLTSILRVLKSQGKLAMDIVDGQWMRENFEKRSWEWIDENHFVCRERALSKDKTRIISREVIVHAERGVIVDQFYAERLYSFEDIESVLQKLQFTNVTLHTHLLAQSDRNQDLGMMASRMFITAEAPSKKMLTHAKDKKRSLLVLLGDPRLPDQVKRNGQFNSEDLYTINYLKQALDKLNFQVKYIDNHSKIIDYLRQYEPNFVLNFCDEGFNNKASLELHIPALLEMLNIPYSGAGPACLAMCYNKSVVRALANSLEIPVPLETYFDSNDQSATIPSIFPAILKPALGDSSIGITADAVVHNSISLVAYLEDLKKTLPDTPILIQEYLSGAEYTVGIIGNSGNYTILPILTVDYSELPTDLPRILGYESKWLPDSVYWNNIQYIEAQLDPDTERQLIDYSSILFERLGCRDYARFDFRANAKGEIKLLEVNPNPGWCWDGKLNLMAQFAGKSYEDLLNMIITAAYERLQLGQ
ncbi:MAG: methyltransferase domain-containing protein [Gammaproteobacteria bacterium]